MTSFVTYKRSTANYTVVNTGYTARLARRFNFIPYKIEESLLIKIEQPQADISTVSDCSDNQLTENRSIELEKSLEIAIPHHLENHIDVFDDNDDVDDDDDDDNYHRYGPIFIYDEIWGTGLYISPEIEIENYTNDIHRILGMITDKSGIIVFGKEPLNTDCISWLHRLDYCRWFDVVDTEFMVDQSDHFNLMITHVDTESG